MDAVQRMRKKAQDNGNLSRGTTKGGNESHRAQECHRY